MSDDPIRLADGTLVYKDGRLESPKTYVQENIEPSGDAPQSDTTARDPSQLLIPAAKKLADLPEPARTMNGIAAVLAYSLFGIHDDEIATAIGTTTDRIDSIKNMHSYVTMRNEIISNVIAAEQADVRELFVKHSRAAVHTVVESMNSRKVADRLRAAGDILDRSGFRPADVVEHRHRLEGGLTIEIVRKEVTAPLIDLNIMED